MASAIDSYNVESFLEKESPNKLVGWQVSMFLLMFIDEILCS